MGQNRCLEFGFIIPGQQFTIQRASELRAKIVSFSLISGDPTAGNGCVVKEAFNNLLVPGRNQITNRHCGLCGGTISATIEANHASTISAPSAHSPLARRV